MDKTDRVRLALDGQVAQRDLRIDEARRFDAEMSARIDAAVARADFSSAPLPDFAAVIAVPHRVLADLAEHAQSRTLREHRPVTPPR